jgi:hypothetical protein
MSAKHGTIFRHGAAFPPAECACCGNTFRPHCAWERVCGDCVNRMGDADAATDDRRFANRDCDEVRK